MNIIIPLSIIALLFAYLNSIGRFKYGLQTAFLLIILVTSVRFDYGNDYMNYYLKYSSTTYSLNFSQIFSMDYLLNESGWVLCCKTFSYLGGFFSMVIFLTVFQNFIYYKLIHDFLPQRWYWFGVFIYLFNCNFFLTQLSMLRQAFAMSLFIIAVLFILKRNLLLSSVFILLSLSIHKSAIILFPFLLLCIIPVEKIKKVIAVIILGLHVLFLFSSSYLNNVFNLAKNIEVLDTYSNVYLNFSEADKEWGIGYLLFLIPILVSLYFMTKSVFNKNLTLLAIIACSVLVLSPFNKIISLIGRLQYYLGIFSIIVYPYAYSCVKNKRVKRTLLFLYIFILLYTYVAFFNSPNWIPYTLPFRTIFEVL